jgi:hypothetical protein
MASPLERLEYCRLSAVPRRDGPDSADPRPDPVAAQLVAALTGTHTTGTPVAVA